MPVLENPRHEIFATDVAAGKNQTEAAIGAGYKAHSARITGSKLLTNPNISARITELVTEYSNAKLVDARKLHIRWSEAFDADIADIIEPDSDTSRMRLKPIHQWPIIWRRMLSAIDVKELFEPSSDGKDKAWDKIGELVKMKFMDQLKLGELIGNLKTVDAFTHPMDKLGEGLSDLAGSIDRAIAEGRQRASQRNRVIEAKVEEKK